MSLLLIDLDHFKFVNDRFGHSAGDEVLRVLADVVRCELRLGDAFGRLGGEEFGVLLPGTALEEAAARAEAIRHKISALQVPCLGDHAVTVSCGVALWQTDRPEVEDWLAAADVALYAAKRSGRDQVVMAA